MRKIVNIFLVIILLLSSTGVVVSRHFCGEILQSIAINNLAQSCCDGEHMPDDCCSDQVSIEKTDEVQLSQMSLKLTTSPYILLYIVTNFYNFPILKLEKANPVAFFGSSPLPEKEIFILDQAFLL